MLYQVNPLSYPDFITIADTHNCGKVYPLSIAEGIQKGDIFTSSMEHYDKVLFWAYCGFAYLSGKADECFLEDVYKIMSDKTRLASRRFLLMTQDKSIQECLGSKQDVIVEQRYLFQYAPDRDIAEIILPDGYELREIDYHLLEKISGKITPALFWQEANDFLAKGKGYCITCGNDIASWAFSAAVSSQEIDIGIETNPQYRQQGLGLICAQRMIQYVFEQKKEPVWACHYKNTASYRMAEKSGFVKVSECSVIRRCI